MHEYLCKFLCMCVCPCISVWAASVGLRFVWRGRCGNSECVSVCLCWQLVAASVTQCLLWWRWIGCAPHRPCPCLNCTRCCCPLLSTMFYRPCAIYLCVVAVLCALFLSPCLFFLFLSLVPVWWCVHFFCLSVGRMLASVCPFVFVCDVSLCALCIVHI